MHRAFQQLDQFQPREPPNLTNAAALIANQDRLLRRAGDVDGAINAHRPIGLFSPGFGFNRSVMRHFLMRLAQDLFAHNLSRQHAVGQIGQIIFREKKRPGRHGLCEPIKQ